MKGMSAGIRQNTNRLRFPDASKCKIVRFTLKIVVERTRASIRYLRLRRTFKTIAFRLYTT